MFFAQTMKPQVYAIIRLQEHPFLPYSTNFATKRRPRFSSGVRRRFLKNYLFSPRSLDKNSFVRSSFGFVKMSFGAPSSTMTP